MENHASQPEDPLGSIWTTEETKKPDESFEQKYWKTIFIVLSLCAVLVDPLLLYIPILKDDFKCLMLDTNLKIAVPVLKSVTDLFYLMNIIIRIYRPKSERGDRQNQMKSSTSGVVKTIWALIDILIDIVAFLPLPQVAILIFFSKMSDLRFLTKTRMVIMNVFALSQYVPRVLRIYLSFKELKRTPKAEIRETPTWIKGVLNFYMYIIASHVFGAMWYFFAIQRMMNCWYSACQKYDGCDNKIFGCHDYHAYRNTTILNYLCPLNSSDRVLFDFGIFATVLQYGIVGSTDYFQKFLICFWWGLRNLSSLGSNLVPSVDAWENLYTVFISIIGLLLFLYLIGNLQMYMQLKTSRREDYKHKMLMKQKRKEKGREVELLLFRNGISTRSNKDIKLRIMEKVQEALEESMDTELDNILPILPSDLQSHIENSTTWAKLKQMRMLRGMDEVTLKKIYQQLKPKKYIENIDIIQKDEKLENMLFIVEGCVSIEERSCDFDDSKRGAGELCGEELLRWPFSTSFPDNKPLATESVKAIGVVEALVLKACDLKSIYSDPDTEKKEKPRHIRMMKEDMEQSVDCLIPRNGIPKRLKDIKSQILEEQFQDGDVYWDKLVFDCDKLVSILPLEFQKEINSYMPLTKLKKVRMLRGMDEVTLKIIYQKLEPVRYYENSDIIQKDKPLEKMLFIVEGCVSIEERSCDSNDLKRDARELCGEELLRWPFSTSFPHNKPSATESVKAIGVVEALALKACDLESIYKQSNIAKIEALRHRRMMKEEMEQNIDWLIPRNGIPERLNQDVKSQIMEKIEHQFQQDRVVCWDTLAFDWDNLVSLLPLDFQNEIKSYMPLTKLKEVRMLRGMDKVLLKRIYQKLEPVRYSENNDIIQKDKPLEKMLLIVEGRVSIEERSCDSDDSKRGAGELCGEELLRWPFSTFFPDKKPLATESVKAIGVVEALAFKACDLKSIYKQSDIARTEAYRHRRMMKDEMIDSLMRRNGIPKQLKENIKPHIMEKVEEFPNDKVVYWDKLDFDWDVLVSLLPHDLQNEIKSYMPLTKLKEMPAFQNMEESVLKKICHHLRPMKFNHASGNIIRKDDPIQMFFIVDGLTTQELNGDAKGEGDFFGEELLVWPFSTSFPDRVPTAADSLVAISKEVEALVLTANDMKSVATEFQKHFIK